MKAVLFALLAASLQGAPAVERGEINGAAFRIDIPEPWNGGLVMFCHGYSAAPVSYAEPGIHKTLYPFLEQGYAVAQSAFAATGWAIEEGVHDTEALRRYFVRKYGAPKETYISGGSMGGFLVMAILEQYPNVYRGGLAQCGPLAPADVFIERRGFDLRVVFDVYFPGALPAVDKVPADFKSGPETIRRILALLDGKPKEAELVRRFGALEKNAEAAWALVLFTDIIRDVQRRGGGNPFDNNNTIYDGGGDNGALNEKVKRYRADRGAVEYLRDHYTPTGRILQPMLALHTIYDPLVPVWIPGTYSLLAARAGTSDLFVQQWTRRARHCGFEPAEVGRAFTDLRRWIDRGEKPTAGFIGDVPR